VLGGAPDAYADYVGRVRAEYAHLSDADFVAGRAAVLRRLLGLDPLFRTATARSRWQHPARVNLAAELAALEPPQAPPTAGTAPPHRG
jgi:predicted metal-dependent HD superfamily phosphohydrolase